MCDNSINLTKFVFDFFNYIRIIIASDEDTRESEEPLVADVTHDPSETPVVPETPVVDDDYSHVKKKPCLNDRDKNPPLDKDRETTPGLEEQSSWPGQ